MILINLSSCSLFYTTQDTPRRVDAIPLFGEKIDKSSTPGAFCVMENEIWKPLPGLEDDYMVSTFGSIKSLDRKIRHGHSIFLMKKGRVLKQQTTGTGYLYASIAKDGKVSRSYVHRLVAMTFLYNPNELKDINHKDGNKKNNRVENLEWCNRSDNLKHARDSNLLSICKVTWDNVRDIRRDKKSGKFTSKELAAKYGISKGQVNNILLNKTWKE
jgi:hypothetical protein